MTVSIQTLTKIIEVQASISAELSVSRVMQTVTETTQEITGASGAIVEIAEGDDMVYRGATGIAAAYLGIRLKVANSLSGLCVRTGNVLCCHDSETDDRVDRSACRRVGLRSMVVVPLRRGEQTVGVLKVVSEVPGKFTETDAQVLQLMSNLIAGAMHNAAKYESTHAQSLHDALTGLPNRVLFHDRTAHELAQLRRKRRSLAVLFIDLDGFKPVNDRHGHKIGDELLISVSDRLRRDLRQNDTVARMGGDEFAVLAVDLSTWREAEEIRDRIIDSIENESFELAVGAVTIGASVGIAFTDGNTSPEAILEQADMAMYTAKRQRKASGKRAELAAAGR